MEPEKLFSLLLKWIYFSTYLGYIHTHTLQSDAVSLTRLPHATHASVIRVYSLKSTIFCFVLNSQLETEPLFFCYSVAGYRFHLYSAFNLFPMDEPHDFLFLSVLLFLK